MKPERQFCTSVMARRSLSGLGLRRCRNPGKFLVRLAGHRGILGVMCGVHARPYRERPSAYTVTSTERADRLRAMATR